MPFAFGPFRLDEPGRVLRLAEREMPLQPRVFDLLVYLVNARDRVVSKDELLDALWPGVTVTEGSLQRAASMLRAALREGGMEEAIRSYPRIGYRFCIGDTPPEAEPAQAMPEDRAPSLPGARRAVAEQRWDAAVALYEAADGTEALTSEDLDGWALALQCLGRPSDALPVLVRSVSAHGQSGRSDLAAGCAVALSSIHLERGEPPLAKGWLARAQDLVATRPEAPAAGRVQWMASRIAAFEGDPQRALALAEATYLFGQKHRHVEIEALGLMYRGFFKLSLGDTHGGLRTRTMPRRCRCRAMSTRSPAARCIAIFYGPAAPSATGRAPISGRSATASSAPRAGWTFPAPASSIGPRFWR